MQIPAGVYNSPKLFSEAVMGAKLYDWQARIAEAVDQGSVLERVRLAVRTPNESGKSSIVIPVLVLRWLERYPRSKVVLMSADSRQLDSQVMRALHSYRNPHLTHWAFLSREIRTNEGGVMLAFTTDEAARVEGHHGTKGAPLLMIVDEAKSVDDAIFQGIDRCGYAVLVVISSPGLRSGNFFECFSSNRSTHLCFEIGLKDCPHIGEEKIKDMIGTYGEKHPLVRSSIYGEFMDQSGAESFVVPYEPLMAIMLNPPHARVSKHEYAGFVDFAVTRDENTLAIRSGNKLMHLVCFHGTDAVSIVGRYIMEFRKYGIKADQLWGDSGGLGLPMCDMLRDAGWPINRFSFGAPAVDDDHYTSRGSEVWHMFAQRVIRGELALINDPILVSQLTSRKTVIDARGRLGLEKKEDMAKRGVKSPDRADAVVGAFAHGVQSFATFVKAAEQGPWADLEKAYEGYERDISSGRFNTEERQQLEDLGAWTG
jgi:hypothetical protein